MILEQNRFLRYRREKVFSSLPARTTDDKFSDQWPWINFFFFFFFFLLSDHNHQVDYFVAMARACYVCVAINHRTLTWTTGSLTRAQMLMHAIALGGVRTPKKSVHWKLNLGNKCLAAPGNRTCVSGVTVRCSTEWATPRPIVLSNGLNESSRCMSSRSKTHERLEERFLIQRNRPKRAHFRGFFCMCSNFRSTCLARKRETTQHNATEFIQARQNMAESMYQDTAREKCCEYTASRSFQMQF